MTFTTLMLAGWLGIEYLLTTAPLFVVAWVAVAVVVAAGAGRLASRR